MLSEPARKRFEHHRDELEALKNACRTVKDEEVAAAFERYQMRLGQFQAGWQRSMEYRARRLLEADKRPTARVWELVGRIREIFGEEYGDMAAEIAVSVLAPLQRQKKPLSAFKTE
jgi:hypothetical protein